MKKHPYISFIAATTSFLVLAIPAITSAQTVIDTEASVGIGASMDSGQGTNPLKLREALKQKIQQNYQTYEDRLRSNENTRNTLLDKRSTTTPIRPIPPVMMRKLASSTENRIGEIREHAQAVRREIFTKMRDRLVEQLTHALDNLKQIRTRISARIDLETRNGKDMSAASRLLITADGKITLADQAIRALKAFTPSATTTIQADASANIDLGRPREIGEIAIKAVNDARRALNEVVVAIARALGLRLGQEIRASSTINTSASHQ